MLVSVLNICKHIAKIRSILQCCFKCWCFESKTSLYTILLTGLILYISMYICVCLMHLYVIKIVFFKIIHISCIKGQNGWATMNSIFLPRDFECEVILYQFRFKKRNFSHSTLSPSSRLCNTNKVWQTIQLKSPALEVWSKDKWRPVLS